MPELRFSGAYTALVTPFSPDGTEVDYSAYEKLVLEQITGGIAGLVPCGTTGEAPTLTDTEQRELIARAVKLAKGKAVVMAGTGSNSTKKTIEASKSAFEAGADAVMIVMPYYNKPSQEGLFNHVSLISKAVSGPVVLYNIPGRAAVDLSVDTLLRILDACPNVVGLKDASGNVLYCQEVLSRAKGRITILSGDDALTLPMMSVGAEGVISVTSNVYPKHVADVVSLAQAGQYAEAARLNLALFPVHRAMFSEPNPAPAKVALALKGRMSASTRPPMSEATPTCRERLQEVMRAFEAA
jgi:4-hydroxy-tetrahydrodipicolinate synthase